MMNGRLVRYAPWMARDYMFWSGVATYVLVFGFGWLWWQGMSVALSRMADPALISRAIHSLARELTTILALLGPLIATAAMVSSDRHHGYYRFLFSRPVHPPRYYATIFGVNGLGFLLIAGLLWTTFILAISPMRPIGFLPMMALSYLFVGGILFLVSVLVRFDLLLGILLYTVSAVAWGSLDGGVEWVKRVRALVWLLPPVSHHHRLLASLTMPEVVVSWKAVAWVAGYGLACFALGLLLLRRRGFAE